MVAKKWITNIHIAKTKTGISKEEYSAILAGAAGVSSSTKIKNWTQYEAVMAAFKVLGFKLSKNKQTIKKQRNPEWITERQEFYIQGLWKLASRKKDEKSLRAIIKRISDVDDITFLKKKDATKVILALRAIASAEGFNPDRKGD